MKPQSKVAEKIIDRTIFLIGQKGSKDVTVRDIAKAAGVNIAAINYYFDSKEQMFSVVEDRFSSAFGEVAGQLQDSTRDPEERLIAWAAEIMGYLVDYPGVLNLVSRMAALPDPFGAALKRHITTCFHGIRALMAEIMPNDDDEHLDFKTVMLTSALAQPETILRGCPFDGDALRDPQTRVHFLHLLMDQMKR